MTLLPLHGVRVLDLSNVLAGPFCCHQLAHMGAEVIKVEAVGRGDLARQLGSDADLNARNMGISFLAQNAGKKSVTLNLKDPRGKDLLKRLVATADVLVENFRPGVMARLGLDHPVLSTVNERLIYCALSGFGQTGPFTDRPAYDQIVQGMSGAMSITGEAGGAPLRAGFPISDTVGGMTAAFAIAAALNARPRGAFIDVSMLEATMATMGWAVSNFLIGGVVPGPQGNENITSAPSGTFQTGDGLLNIAANKDDQWQALASHLGRADLLADPDYATREARKTNRHALRQTLEADLARHSAMVWAAELNAIGVPAGPVMSVPDVLAHDQIRERDFLKSYPSVPGVGRDITVARTGFQIDGATPQVATPPPELGQDTDAVFGALGLEQGALAHLRKDGVI